MDCLDNYKALLTKVDGLVAAITNRFGDHITCHRGCDSCCRHLSLSVVEGAALATALKSLTAGRVRSLRQRAQAALPDGPCPLLENGACILYADRPIICRTHGLPILIVEEGRPRLDYCPRNFNSADALSGDAVIDLEKLNTILAAVNELFIAQFPGEVAGKDRLSIAEALLLEI
jgi:hypothetical protein